MNDVMKSVLVPLFVVFALSVAATPAVPTGPNSVDGLVVWLRADDVDGDGNIDESPGGSRVAVWTDLSGCGNHVRQGTVDRQPIVLKGVIGGHPVLRFDGGDCFELAKTSGLNGGDQPFHAVFVMQATMSPPQPNPRLLDLGGAAVAADRRQRGFWVGYQGNGRNRLGISNGDHDEARRIAWNGQPNVLEVTYAGRGRWSQHLNGASDGRGTYQQRSFLGFHEPVQLAIGQHFGLTQTNTFYNGDLAEVLLFNRALTPTEQNEIGLYLSRRYGINTTYGPLPRFEKDIVPILARSCLDCHGSEQQEGRLDLRTVSAMLQGGNSGSVLVRGHSDRSYFLQMITSGEMPPEGEKPLAAKDIALLRRWVDLGALADERVVEPSPTDHYRDEHRKHWAFQKPAAVTPPQVRQQKLVRSAIDAFVLRRLEAEGLTPAPAAGRTAWLRRATFDLTGLPPTPEEIDAFVSDDSTDAFETVVDRLLKSPAYGQRWARHWLDVARYADYHDFDPKARVAICETTEAWRYRDWVVDSLNRDLPYDQFIVHQIAGDQLPGPAGEEIYPDGLIATTFLSNGVWDRGDADKEKIISDMVDDNIGVIGKAFLGLTLDCARCHDHKFDPISTEDYYALAGMFYSSHILKDLGAKGGNYTVNRVPLLGPKALARRAELQKQLGTALAKLAEMDQKRRFEELIAGGQRLVPTSFKSEAGATATIADDAGISVRGNLTKDRYTIEAAVTDAVRVRFLRIEALPEADLAAGGPGRASDGNFVVTQIRASFTPPGPDAAEERRTGLQPVPMHGQVANLSYDAHPLKFVSARADFEQKGFAADSVLNDEPKVGWAVAPQFGRPHIAVFDTGKAITIPANSRISVVIEHQYAPQHALGKFRLSVAESLPESPTTTEYRELKAASEKLQQQLADPVPLAMAVTDGGTRGGLFPGIQDVPVHIRGSYTRLGPVVPRRLPGFFVGDDQSPIEKGSGRRELANWIASSDNPMTARVIVNRVWHWHFGAGLVRTPNNFGMLSEPPSHPELLDWLATTFVEDGWSLKKLHRRIMLSSTYRQGSRISDETFDKDPENRLLGRFNARRLEAEAIRDAILSVSGQLDRTAGGPAGDDFTIHRRSLYVQRARWQRDSYAMLFDAANPDSSTAKRDTSTVAPQALLLLNHPWVHDQAQHLADRLAREFPQSHADRIDAAYRLLFGRVPKDEERKIAQQIVSTGESARPGRGWTNLAHVLLCANEFIYLD